MKYEQDQAVQQHMMLTRRHFFGRAASGLGGLALLSMLPQEVLVSRPRISMVA